MAQGRTAECNGVSRAPPSAPFIPFIPVDAFTPFAWIEPFSTVFFEESFSPLLRGKTVNVVMLIFKEDRMPSVAPHQAVLVTELGHFRPPLSRREGFPEGDLMGPAAINGAGGEFTFASVHPPLCSLFVLLVNTLWTLYKAYFHLISR